MNYYLGIDNGGTMTKAALFTANGEEIGVKSIETAVFTPFIDHVERDMIQMRDANFAVIKDLLDSTKIDPAQIKCIACCGHGKGLYLWGKDDKPVRRGIISTDNRAFEYPIKWQKDGTEKNVFAISCQHIMACQPVSLLAWLRDNEPECIEKIKYIFECKDYVRFCLTGEAYAELTDYSGANLLNLHTLQYDKELLNLFGLDFAFDMLPPLKNSSDFCGSITKEVAALTGLLEGTPVVGGMFDIDACAIAVGAADEDKLCMIAGTWSINEYIRKQPVLDGKVMMNSIFCIPEYFLIEESSSTSAGNNEWFIKTLLPELKATAKDKGESIYDVCNQMVSSLTPEDFCPIFLPYLTGSNVHPNAKGSIIGMSSFHTRAHIIRSIYEGIAFCHRYHFEKLLATRDKPVKSIQLAGGVAKSTIWSQMFADIMQHPVAVVDVNETGALGCAMTAAVAVGEYESIKQATQKMLPNVTQYSPDESKKEIYDKKYALYLKIIQTLDCVWDDMHKLTK